MKTSEPSIAQEVDDTLLAEFGMFTSLPTGFRILNYSKTKEKADAFKIRFKEACKAAGLKKLNKVENQRRQIERRIDKFFDKVGA
ncbi:MAG TPA: hypothetical protein VGO67_03545 [Verrucomicrobiae bacterium]|jgi:uncharacterized membrane protein (DUF106 family)|nr:hypothetical protein [Verrucomicrobiae bacterium]